jgi:endonuclease YncB( thermonuclease family)
MFLPCQVVRVKDGHTVVVQHEARLSGIMCHSLDGELARAGEAARQRLEQLIYQSGDDLCCRVHFDRSGGVCLELFPHAKADVAFNTILLTEGYAELA